MLVWGVCEQIQNDNLETYGNGIAIKQWESTTHTFRKTSALPPKPGIRISYTRKSVWISQQTFYNRSS